VACQRSTDPQANSNPLELDDVMPSDPKEQKNSYLTLAEEQTAGFSRQFAMAMELPFVIVSAIALGGLTGFFLFHLDDQGFKPLPQLFKRIAIQEMVHVELLAERISF